MDAWIETQHLFKQFGPVWAVSDLSFRVLPGEIYGLAGPDGAGKTTSLRLLCGAYLPTPVPDRATRLQICGFDVLTQTEQARSQVGYLPQRFSLYEELTVIENIRFFAEARGLEATEWLPRCLEILRFVGLENFTSRRAGQLSGGMKQKLGLAAALVHRPRVLLLDEPTTGVDPVTRQDFWQLIIRLAKQEGGTAVLVSTPYMDEAARCTRIGFMSQGRLQLEGTPVELRARLDGRIAELVGEPLPKLRSLMEQWSGVEGVQMFGDRLHLRLAPESAGAILPALRERLPGEGVRLDHVGLVSPGLEDVFMELLEAED